MKFFSGICAILHATALFIQLLELRIPIILSRRNITGYFNSIYNFRNSTIKLTKHQIYVAF